MQIKLALIEENKSFSPYLESILKNEKDIHFSHIIDHTLISNTIIPNIDDVDIALIQLDLSEYSCIDLLAKLKKRFPNINYFIVSHFENDQSLFDTLKSGAHGYILKTDHPELIIENIRETIAGKASMSKEIAVKMLDFFHNLHKDKGESTILSEREISIISLLADGKLYKEISEILTISIDSVKKNCSTIYKKLHVHNRTEAVNEYFNQ